MKYLNIITGDRKIGKTYTAISHLSNCCKRVVLITDNDRSKQYFLEIIKETHPEHKAILRDNDIIIRGHQYIPVKTYKLNDRDLEIISLANIVYIDEYSTLMRLADNDKFIDATKNSDIIVTISNYDMRNKNDIARAVMKFKGKFLTISNLECCGELKCGSLYSY